MRTAIALAILLTSCTPATMNYTGGAHYECTDSVLLGQSCLSTSALTMVAAVATTVWLLWRLVSFFNVVETRIRSIDEHVEKTRRHLERLGD